MSAIFNKLEHDIPQYTKLYSAVTEQLIRSLEYEFRQLQAIDIFRQQMMTLVLKLQETVETLAELAAQTLIQLKSVHDSFRAGEDDCEVGSQYFHGERIRFWHLGKPFSHCLRRADLMRLADVIQGVGLSLEKERTALARFLGQRGL